MHRSWPTALVVLAATVCASAVHAQSGITASRPLPLRPAPRRHRNGAADRRYARSSAVAGDRSAWPADAQQHPDRQEPPGRADGRLPPERRPPGDARHGLAPRRHGARRDRRLRRLPVPRRGHRRTLLLGQHRPSGDDRSPDRVERLVRSAGHRLQDAAGAFLELEHPTVFDLRAGRLGFRLCPVPAPVPWRSSGRRPGTAAMPRIGLPGRRRRPRSRLLDHRQLEHPDPGPLSAHAELRRVPRARKRRRRTISSAASWSTTSSSATTSGPVLSTILLTAP